MIKKLIFLITLLLFVGCSADETPLTYDPVHIGESEITSLHLSSIVLDYDHIPIAKNDQTTVPWDADRIGFHNGNVIIFNRQREGGTLHQLDVESGQIRQIGGTGQGPGEYEAPEDIHINREHDQLVVLDNAQRKLIYYSLEDFSLFEERIFEDFNASRFYKKDDHYYFRSGGGMDDIIIVTDRDFDIKSKHIENDIRHHSRPVNSFYSIGDELIYFTRTSDRLYTFKGGSRVDGRKIRFSNGNFSQEAFENMSVSEGDYDEFFAYIEDYRTNFVTIEETGEVMYLFYFYDGAPYIALKDKIEENSINMQAEGFENDITHEEMFRVLGKDADGYFLSYTYADNLPSDKLEDLFGTPEVAGFITRFKIDPEKIGTVIRSGE